MRAHRLALAAFVVVVLFGVVTSPVAAQESACDAALDDATNATAGPGGQLADAIGDQGSEIGSELNDRWFDARLANATSDEERATIIGSEVERIENRLEAVEQCWSTHQEARQNRETADQLDPEEVEDLQREAQILQRRINETRVEASNISASIRERHGISDESITELERRIERLRESLPALNEASPTREG